MRIDNESFWDIVDTGGAAQLAEGLTTDEAIDMTQRYGAHNYGPIPVSIVSGDGARVVDADGNKYIDCIGAYSAVALGHNAPAIRRAIAAQMDRLSLTGRAVYTPYLAVFLKALCSYCEMEMACPMNTGAEAVETAIKIARKWAYTVKGVPNDLARIVVASGNFHGRTTTIVGFSSQPQYRDGFGPFSSGFDTVAFGDSAALNCAIGPHTAAVLLEPIQAEGGIIVPPAGYLRDVRRICDAAGALLVLDEVQTGFCRTGRRFAWQYEDARPDLICVGKALGGGAYPVSAALGSREVMGVLKPGGHGSTFGGNPIACAVAVATMAQMRSLSLERRAALIGSRIRSGLASLSRPAIKEIRGKGLLIGVEFTADTDIRAVAAALRKNGVLTGLTHHRTFRLTPPLIIDEPLADEIVDRFGSALTAF